MVKWHPEGFRIYWRWRSRCPGRPKTSAEIRALIRRMSRANPLWGAPRIHGELLKLDIEVSEATVGRHLPRCRNAPSPTGRSFLRNHMTALAAVDMFVVVTATFELLYAVRLSDRDNSRRHTRSKLSLTLPQDVTPKIRLLRRAKMIALKVASRTRMLSAK
jgi:putative transposase